MKGEGRNFLLGSENGLVKGFLFRVSSLRRVRFVSMAQKSSNFGIFDAEECDPNFLFTGITYNRTIVLEFSYP